MPDVHEGDYRALLRAMKNGQNQCSPEWEESIVSLKMSVLSKLACALIAISTDICMNKCMEDVTADCLECKQARWAPQLVVRSGQIFTRDPIMKSLSCQTKDCDLPVAAHKMLLKIEIQASGRSDLCLRTVCWLGWRTEGKGEIEGGLQHEAAEWNGGKVTSILPDPKEFLRERQGPSLPSHILFLL